MSQLSSLLKNPVLRLVGLALLGFGMQNASVYPYQSLIAIERIGLSKPSFSLVLVLASAVAVSSSVLFGLIGDLTGRRRMLALITMAGGSLGLLAMNLAPGPWSFILTHGVLLPVGSSLYGQIFALMRVALPEDGPERAVAQANVRSAMSTSFLLTMVFWTLAFRFGAGVMAVYVTGGAAALGLLALIWTSWPADREERDTTAGEKLRHGLVEIARPAILIRVLMLGAVASAGNIYMVLVSLVFEASPLRGPGDVALYVGLVAGWEVPAMLYLPRLVAHRPRAQLLFWGALLYACHLAMIPVLTDTPFIWAMTLAAGVGGAAIITLPITYYQDLLQGRPGAAGSMLAVQKLAADLCAATAFYLGTRFGGGFGYELVAAIGVALSLGGAGLLIVADSRSWLQPRAPARSAA